MVARLSDAVAAAGHRHRRSGAADGTARSYGLRALAPAGVFVLLVSVAAASGGYFPRTWGWIALPVAWVAVLAVVFRSRIEVSTAELAFLGGISAFVAWVSLSVTWSSDVPQTVLEIERDLLYSVALLALVVVVRRSSTQVMLASTAAATGVISLYALGTRLLPDRIGTFRASDPIFIYRLADPLGYWNALGIFSLLGLLIAIGFAVRSSSLVVRTVAAAWLPVFLTTIYFTFGRGVWVALGVALVAAVAVDPRRRQLCAGVLALAPASILAVLISSRADGLTERGSSIESASHDGHRTLVWILLLIALSAGLGAGFSLLERRVRPSPRARRAGAGALVAAAVALLVAVFVAYGSPPTLARKAYDAFKAPAIVTRPGESFNERLFNLSGNGRIDQWGSSWRDFKAQPLLGDGAGSYEQSWNRHRQSNLAIRDAHSLYVEVLGELGIVGLLLLAAALAVPLALGVRVRDEPLMPLAWAAYVAFVFHVGVDWDWEMPSVIITGLLIGTVLLVRGRRQGRTVRVGRRGAVAAVAALTAAAGFSVVGLLGNIPLDRAVEAFDQPRFDVALKNSHKAIRWMPWAAQPWQTLGRAQRGTDQPANARASFLRALDRNPNDWSIWFDLGTVSSGRARTCAYVEAARLNPRENDIVVLRQRGLLPKKRAADAALRCVPQVAKAG